MTINVNTDPAPQVTPEVQPIATPQVQPEVAPVAAPEAQPQAHAEETLSGEQSSPNLGQAKEIQNIINEQSKAVDEAKALVASKGLQYDALVSEYMENGTLTDATYATLEAAGISRSLIDGFAEGLNATNQLFNNQVMQSVGGEKEFDIITSFVTSRGQNAVSAFNNIMEKGDLNTITDYLSGIKAQMQLTKGTANPSLLGGSTQVSSGFASMSELTKAMDDPRYAKDSQYRSEVTAKLAKSNLITFKKY